MKTKIVIGTRGSKLAVWQTEFVKSQLEKYFPEIIFEINIIKTTGDKILDSPLSQIGDKALFTKELENALLKKEIDFAVHSLKDLPTQLPNGLTLASVLEREKPNDVLISKNNLKLSELPKNAIAATGSLRRTSQLLHYRNDLQIIDLRGNVDTRFKKFDESSWTAMLLAYAGVKRMNYENRIAEIISTDILLPAVGQAAIGIETRIDDTQTIEVVMKLNHNETEICVKAERAFLRRLEGGCQIPIGANVHLVNDKLFLDGLIASLNGKILLRDSVNGKIEEAESLGISLAETLLAKGGNKILDEIRK
ncbi:MAG: hydroxymethylbilane synthase [Ignavibacteriales bacterium]|nr:hydroxymethylbilane synthase [Ignavibacteriales bacterium]